MIYLDNNATTQPDTSMLSSVMDVISNDYGNPSSSHIAGRKIRDAIEHSRVVVAKSLGAKPHQIIFTSGGTEANNLALHDKVVIGSVIEHSSVFNYLKNDHKVNVLKNGTLDFLDLDLMLKNIVSKKRLCVSIMLANNETGIVLDPLNRLAEFKNKYNFILHVDAVQALGKGIDINVDNLNADLLTISAHKIHGLKGAGALYVRDPDLIQPILKGGAHEYGRRPGTENVAGILSLGYMCNKILNFANYKGQLARVEFLKNRFENLLSDIALINGSESVRIANTSSISINGIHDLDLFLESLSEAGLCVSGKSACSTGFSAPSRVLSAMYGAHSPRLQNTLRVSLSVNTTSTEIDDAVNIIRETRQKMLKEIGV